MSLRKDWSSIKDMCFDAYKTATAKENTRRMANHQEPIYYPLTFNKDLGPTLDKFEKAKTQTDKTKYAEAARKVIVLYIQQVRKHEEQLEHIKVAGHSLPLVLKTRLENIEKALVVK